MGALRVHGQESLGYVAKAGLFYRGSFLKLGSQVVGTLARLAGTGMTSGLVFLALSKGGVLRISQHAEEIGVDAAEHMPLVPQQQRPDEDRP